MKLPGRSRASVPERKLTAYLLSLSHPIGRSKARFFRKHGFDQSNTDLLRAELLNLAQREDVTHVEQTSNGTKYIVEGSIFTPSDDITSVRTVWMIEDPAVDAPRLVTAYPV